jgi:hypothetical protein
MKGLYLIMRLMLIAVVAMNPAVFWEVTLCSLIEIYHCPLKTAVLYQVA